jgi:predicted nucleic acid-binding protein
MKAVIDTRFLIAHFFGQADLNNWTRNTLQLLQKADNRGFVPSIVVHEFYKFVFQNRGKTVADLRTQSLLSSDLKTVNLDSIIGVEAAKFRCKYAELPTADAIIAATATITGCDYVLTDDRHIRQIKETKTKWL